MIPADEPSGTSWRAEPGPNTGPGSATVSESEASRLVGGLLGGVVGFHGGPELVGQDTGRLAGVT